jgi:hypothetical protein
VFSSDRVAAIDPAVFTDDQPHQRMLSTCASQLKIAGTDQERDVIDRCPISLQVALLATLRAAVGRSKDQAARDEGAVPVSFSWIASYDFELTIFEARPGPSSWGGVTIILRTPYPE